MGSRRDAFSAGQRPKKRPTLVVTVNPAMMDRRGTAEGKPKTKVRIARLSSQPARMADRAAGRGDGHAFECDGGPGALQTTLKPD